MIKLINKCFLTKIFFFLLVLLPAIHWSQNIKGKVTDNENNPLEYASVSIVNPKDSILISYANTDKNGVFILDDIIIGKHLILIHLVGFKIYQNTIDYSGESIDMGVIILESDTDLEEVVLSLVTPISIKKDTVIYNAKAFKTNTDDTVEDLLKKLPGIDVDISGKITAQGEEVIKIYIDGKEFFSRDPAIATKNLSADFVKRIEVIDEKSERFRVTGINDSERKKVINLKIKEDKKVNDFGKYQGGWGTDDRFLTSLNYNRFTPKLQTAVIGKYNNVNSAGSDISDIMVIEIGGRTISGDAPGFLTTAITGLNLGVEINENQNLNTDYFYNYTNSSSGEENIKKTEFIGALELNTESKNIYENISNNHSLNISYRDQSAKFSSLFVNGSIARNDNNGNGINTLTRYNGQDELALESIGKTSSNSKSNYANFSIEYTKRLNEKSRRNFTVFANFNRSENENFSSNNQISRFNVADPDSTYEIVEDISREQQLQNSIMGISLYYTEPLAKTHFIEVKSTIGYVSTENGVNQSKFENDIVQNPLIFNQYYKNTDLIGGVFYKYDKEKITFTIGSNFASQTQVFGLQNENEYNNRYNNFNPEVSLQYRPKRGNIMSFNLRKTQRLASLSQLTPVVNDFNSLYIKIGNPNLSPEKHYSATIMLVDNGNIAKSYNFSSRLRYTYITNSIVNSEFTDPLGIQTSTFMNLGNRNNINCSVKLGKRLASLGLRYNVSLHGGYHEYLSMINTEINETQSKNGRFNILLENDKKEKIDALIGATLNKNYTTFSSGNNADREYLQQSYYTKIDWNIADRLNLNSQFKYDIYTDSNFGTNQSVPIWNTSISYSILKSKKLIFMITGLDLLNKNIGLIRTSSDNYFEEVQQEVLSNYYMFSLVYNQF
ncbi:outer membrane beta-barrel protein [Lentiprolixibacter aurantiacus]|uniref:Outer membrane beta-barrel protein n=1 Tax=Lentiprolixibacter aurantiacus TaxID=2993939 RepID=A0AAE3SNK4_9FLAO|nr:outer membrane beta-barrel protein [Lentiprolixibacter aurantiacus]MCX2719729.1 outer membrane beta-barrel protein [Lentiprolixibacter aurantiacus]